MKTTLLWSKTLNKEQALNFLRQHQPLPPDEDLTEELIMQFREVLDYCRASLDPDCIPLLLNIFGDGSGWENYEYVSRVLWRYPAAQVLPHLQKALQSGSRSIRYWSAEVASFFPYPELIPALKLLASEADEDMRFAAVRALTFIEDDRVDALLKDRIYREPDELLREQIKETLQFRQTPQFHIVGRRWRKEEAWPEMLDMGSP